MEQQELQFTIRCAVGADLPASVRGGDEVEFRLGDGRVFVTDSSSLGAATTA
jgi:hypothetical protein